MYEFEYRRAKTIEEAVAAIEADEDAVLLAGGHTLIPTLKQRLAQPSAVIDIAQIAGLGGIAVDEAGVTIGATTTHAEVERSAEVARAIPALAVLAGHIGDPQVRHRGTIGGSIANNDPTADYPAACVGLGATIHTTRRAIPADDFFTDLFETALEEGEIVTKVTFPAPEKAAYMKFPNPASRYAIVGVFVAKTAAGARVAVTGAGAYVFRVTEMEAALDADFTPEAVADITIPDDDLNSDIHAGADYRAHLVTVMAKRAVAAAE
jgi:carbon-monoxide dehydrogenase medium subunit